MNHSPASFDNKFEGSDDPWGFSTRWYEQRKRALTLAALPAARYGRAYEPGCANGVLSMALAERCDQLLVSDGSPKAVDLARHRLSNLSHVEVIEAWLPEQWPARQFDLLVFSEIGYFLSPDDMRRLLDRMTHSLAKKGTLLACHWRRQADDCEWNGDDVHRFLHERLQLPTISSWVDEDFRLELWGGDGLSVATREGLD